MFGILKEGIFLQDGLGITNEQSLDIELSYYSIIYNT
jgi:hypothetical protein